MSTGQNVKCYTYDPLDHIYMFPLDVPIDLNGKLAIPEYATTAVPPSATFINKARVFFATSGIAGNWNYVDDFRSQTWFNKIDQSQYEITALGTPSSGYTNIIPPSSTFNWNETSGNWILDRETQINYLMQDVIDSNTDNVVLPKGMNWNRPSDNAILNVPLASDKTLAYNQAIDGYDKGIFPLPLTLKGYGTNFILLYTSGDVQSISLSAYVTTSNIITSGWMLKYGGAQFGESSIKALSAMTDSELLSFKDPRI